MQDLGVFCFQLVVACEVLAIRRPSSPRPTLMSRILAPRSWTSCVKRAPIPTPAPKPFVSSLPRSLGRYAVAAPRPASLWPSNVSFLSRVMSTAATPRRINPSKSLAGFFTSQGAGFFTSRRLGSAALANSNDRPKIEDAAAEEPIETPTLAPPIVGRWLIGCAGLVSTIVVVGGITRLTESGLSITEWRPITGMVPPLSEAEWESEFTKYKATPEFKMSVRLFIPLYHATNAGPQPEPSNHPR
jgi:hypothetical protein